MIYPRVMKCNEQVYVIYSQKTYRSAYTKEAYYKKNNNALPIINVLNEEVEAGLWCYCNIW